MNTRKQTCKEIRDMVNNIKSVFTVYSKVNLKEARVVSLQTLVKRGIASNTYYYSRDDIGKDNFHFSNMEGVSMGTTLTRFDKV